MITTFCFSDRTTNLDRIHFINKHKFPSVGVPAEDLLRVPQPDETDHLSPRLERHEASNKPVSPLFHFCHAVFVPERVREYSQPLDQSLLR